MIKFFLLNKDQVIGKNRLNIIKENSISSKPTDFSYYKSKEAGIADRCEEWWVGKKDGELFAGIYDGYNQKYLKVNPNLEGFGIRPAVNFEDIKPFADVFYTDDNVQMAKFGKYPQDFASDDYNGIFNDLLDKGLLQPTGVDSVFKYQNELLIKDMKTGNWITESDLVWVVDRHSGIAVCDRIIDSGKKNYKQVMEFLTTKFAKIIFPEDKIKEYQAIMNYSKLKAKKAETESKLYDINKMMENLENEILVLRRKKKTNEEVL